MKYNIRTNNDFNLPQSLNEFLNYLITIKSVSGQTAKGYKSDLIMFFRFMELFKGNVKDIDFDSIPIGNLDIEYIKNIKLSDLVAFISFTEKYLHNGTHARARKVATLKSFFKYLCEIAELIEKNPATKLDTPKLSKKQPVHLTLDESKLLLDNIYSRNYHRDYCIITLFLNCGMRVSELCSIDINNIKEDTLKIVGKGDKERTVYLNNACIKAINSYMLERKRHLTEGQNALFLNEKKKRISPRAVQMMIKKMIESAGINNKKITPHKLRHTAATLLHKSGVDVREIQAILGHENITTTVIYTHLDDDNLRKAVSKNPLANI